MDIYSCEKKFFVFLCMLEEKNRKKRMKCHFFLSGIILPRQKNSLKIVLYWGMTISISIRAFNKIKYQGNVFSCI